MKILIRTDASIQIGTGHVIRCLTLADTLAARGCDVIFACRNLAGNVIDLIGKRGHRAFAIDAGGNAVADAEPNWEVDVRATAECIERHGVPVDCLVVDHYGLDRRWEVDLRGHARCIMAVDDLANRQHDCDLLLDQNFYRKAPMRYAGLVPDACRLLLGPGYLLLREEFSAARASMRRRDGQVRRILVFFGGSDPRNLTPVVLDAIARLGRPDIAVDVVVGASNPNLAQVQARCEALPNTQFYCQVSDMARLIAEADLAVGAGGAAMWERCFLGLPTITVIFASNQEETTGDMASEGAIHYLGWADRLDTQDYVAALRDLIADPARLCSIGERGLALVGNGEGGSAAVADHLMAAAHLPERAGVL
jgi:UDP-2,4-diacetamido-2,4,6-trideoxy-beta-L-altropyranose hydrolase